MVPAYSLTEAVGVFQTRTLKRKMMKNVDDEVKGKMEGTRLEYIYIYLIECVEMMRGRYTSRRRRIRGLMLWAMKLLLLLLFLDEDESLTRGHPCTRPSVHDDFK